jgi:hypothetical protein
MRFLPKIWKKNEFFVKNGEFFSGWTFGQGYGAAAKATSVAEAEARRRAICAPRTLRVTELRNSRRHKAKLDWKFRNFPGDFALCRAPV